MSQLKVADTNDAPDRAACIALTVRRPQAGMRSTGLMTFPLSLSCAAWLIWLSSLGLHQPVEREAASAPELRRHSSSSAGSYPAAAQ